ncbi:hypothetical protein P9112_009628 [Eukaryota sp. TZLM1-RC]
MKSIRKIKPKFGKPGDCMIVIGDCSKESGFKRKGKYPSKGTRKRKVLRQAGYLVYLVNEAYISKRCHNCARKAIVDFVSCNVANDTLVHRRKLNPVAALDFKAKEKHRKYDKEIEDANIDRNTQLVFIAFPFSINGRLSVEAETFLDDFQKMVKEKTMKRFDIFLWRSRIQFAIINRLPRFFNRIREALARQQANQDFVEEILV